MWLLALRAIFGTIFKYIMAAVNFLVSHPKILAAIVLALVLAGGYFKIEQLNHKIDALIVQRNQLQVQVKDLTTELNTAIATNKQNQDVIDSLGVAKAATQVELDHMRAKQKTTAAALDAIKGNLVNKQDGPVAPVLAEAIKEIQENRDQRSAP